MYLANEAYNFFKNILNLDDVQIHKDLSKTEIISVLEQIKQEAQEFEKD